MFNNNNNKTWIIILVILFIIMGPGEAFMNGGISGVLDWIVSGAAMLPGIIIGLSFHEFGHAKAAELCGDPNPRIMGRVTLDPRAHIDPLGIVSLLFFGFGWGKPVAICPDNFKKRRRDYIIVSLAGVTMNLILALTFGVILRIFFAACGYAMTGVTMGIGKVLLEVVIVNVSLMLFNLIPIPPLDGFNVLVQVFNIENTPLHYKLLGFGRIALLIFIVFERQAFFLNTLIVRVTNFILGTLMGLGGWFYLM